MRIFQEAIIYQCSFILHGCTFKNLKLDLEILHLIVTKKELNFVYSKRNFQTLIFSKYISVLVLTSF